MNQILAVRESPHRIATAFSVGVFIGMSPFLGIHTVLGILISSFFRLNRFVTIVGVFVTNPWTIIPIYTFGTWVGAKVLRIDHIIPKIDWAHITFMELLRDFRPLLMPFLVGCTLTGAVSALIAYVIVHHAVKKSRG